MNCTIYIYVIFEFSVNCTEFSVNFIFYNLLEFSVNCTIYICELLEFSVNCTIYIFVRV